LNFHSSQKAAVGIGCGRDNGPEPSPYELTEEGDTNSLSVQDGNVAVFSSVNYKEGGECHHSSIDLQDGLGNDNAIMRFQSKPTMYNNHVYNLHDFTEFS